MSEQTVVVKQAYLNKIERELEFGSKEWTRMADEHYALKSRAELAEEELESVRAELDAVLEELGEKE